MKRRADVLIAGAGFSGLVLAERLSTLCGLHCVVVDRRPHIGGNAYDLPDRNGVLYHQYGPHYFRTNSRAVVDYLGQFTAWCPVEYRIRSHTHGRLWSFPVNLQTYEELVGRSATEEEFKAWLENERVSIPSPKNSEEVLLASCGRTLYERFFEGYTLKHWKRHPRDLDPSVCGRIPIRTNRDDRYLREEFQALPADGFTAMFERLVESCPRLELRLGTDFAEARGEYEVRHTVYTGPVDAYFGYQFGRLPWRSLRFEVESFTAADLQRLERERHAGRAGYWQSAMQINYPNDHDFTRIVEIKHATAQDTPHTNIVREYPMDDAPDREPYYPIPAPDAREIYARYRALAEKERGVSFIGRLATYHYYNMDQVVSMALHEAEKLTGAGGVFAGCRG